MDHDPSCSAVGYPSKPFAGQIITTTLLGPGTSDNAIVAIESARACGIVHHLIIPWNATADDVGAVPSTGPSTGRIVIGRPYEGASFADARNHALEQARELGAEWAITLDTDERLHTPSDDEGGFLSVETLIRDSARMLAWSVASEDQGYSKPRIIATVPPAGHWVGRTHETFNTGGRPAPVLPGVVFSELPKTPEQLAAKALRDIPLLVAEHEATKDPRWAFYLGESFTLLAHHGDTCDPSDAIEQALHWYLECTMARDEKPWDCYREEGGWAAFKSARLAVERLGDEDLAREQLLHGMAVCPWLAELPWYLAYLEVSSPEKRLAWASMAIALGCGIGIDRPRIGFFEGVARYEGPHDLAGIAYREMGEERRALEEFERAHIMRDLRISRGH